MKKLLLLIAGPVLLAFHSCTMEKRIYMHGYHVEWLNAKNHPNQIELTNEFANTGNPGEVKTSLVTEQEIIPGNRSALNTNGSHSASGQTRGVTVKNRVRNITSSASSAPVVIAKISSKANKKPAMNKAAGKSQLAALLLCIFVGIIGVHRFYLGYVGIGIIQILTLGGLGIWTLIDLIRIITGDLKPRDGEYSKTL